METKIRTSELTKKILQQKEVIMLLLIILIAVVGMIAMPTTFPTANNIIGILLSISIETIVAVGMMILLISGVFDLSVGSVVGISGALATWFITKNHSDPIVAIPVAIAAAAVIGLINGVFVAKVGINAMIQTLAMMGIVRGFAIIVQGQGIVSFNEQFNSIGQGKVFGVQNPIWFMAAIVLIFTLLTTETRYFRKYYFIGANEKAAILSGINAKRHIIAGFAITSTLAGLAGVIMAARFGASVTTAGQGLEMRVITAVVLGGASLSGGQGSILGALVGTAFMGIVFNFMVLSQVNVYWQDIILKTLLILAVATDIVIKKRTMKIYTVRERRSPRRKEIPIEK
jgi:ribose transport system permease protein